jgi:hypothetical protein
VIERVEDPLVLGPGDELVGRVRFDVAVDDAGEVERQVLDRGGEGHSSWICKKKEVKNTKKYPSRQCCGSRSGFGSGLDPDSMGYQVPYPDSQSGSGSRRTKKSHKHRKKLINFIFGSAGCSLLRAEVFSCSLDIGKLQFLIQKFFIYIFSAFGHQNPGSGYNPEPNPDLLEMLDPGPD